MRTKECIAMILAGGRGVRLGALSHFHSKPVIHFGGNFRIIDFTLNNCNNAEIDTIGILSQHFTTDLHAYIGGINNGNYYMRPPENAEDPYMGTADAVYKNIEFIDCFMPDNVIILSGDHIYTMDYKKMIAFHEEMNADVTVASTSVPIDEASRFGILNTDMCGRVSGFQEKPLVPKGDLASMGIYVFKWNTLKKYLLEDNKCEQTQHDFGKDIIPGMLLSGESVYTYRFKGYWRDVGTVEALWKANMDQIDEPGYRLPEINHIMPYIDMNLNIIQKNQDVQQSIVFGDCAISGKVEHSILSDLVTVESGAEIVNSVIMPNAYIGNNVKIYNAVIGTGAIIMDGTEIGTEYGVDFFVDLQVCSHGVSLVEPWLYVGEGINFLKNSHIYKGRLDKYEDIKALMRKSINQYVPYEFN